MYIYKLRWVSLMLDLIHQKNIDHLRFGYTLALLKIIDPYTYTLKNISFLLKVSYYNRNTS